MCAQKRPWSSRATNQLCLWRFSRPGHLNADRLRWGHWTCSCDFGDLYISSIYFGWFIFKIAFHLGRALWNKHLDHVKITFIPCCWYLRNQEFKTLSTAGEAVRESGLNKKWLIEILLHSMILCCQTDVVERCSACWTQKQARIRGENNNSKMFTLRHSHVTWPALVAAPLSDVWHVNTLGPSRANQLPRSTHTFC